MKQLHKEYLSEVFKNKLIKQDTFSIHSFVSWVENRDDIQKESITETFNTVIISKYSGLWLKDNLKY